MDWSDLFAAFALYLIIEGVLPFISPGRWKESVAMMARMNNRQLRVFGLISMLAGIFLLAFVRS